MSGAGNATDDAFSSFNSLPFVKMSGAGNDFVIFDFRDNTTRLTSGQIQKISHRKNIGCDQLIVIGNSSLADCLMEIYNSDGSLSGACGNATRCVAAMLMDEKRADEIKIQTASGLLQCWRNDNFVAVDMGVPSFDWQKIPLTSAIDSQKISLFGFEFSCVNVGNPHAATFINQTLSDEKFFEIGAKVETSPIFPEKTNVEFARILSDELVEVRVWERGAGEALACGSGACAVAILAIKKNLVKSKKITIRFKGGDLLIEWSGDGSSVIMTGGYEKIFEGAIDADFLRI
jgi:diaminopimelate epimerase